MKCMENDNRKIRNLIIPKELNVNNMYEMHENDYHKIRNLIIPKELNVISHV